MKDQARKQSWTTALRYVRRVIRRAQESGFTNKPENIALNTVLGSVEKNIADGCGGVLSSYFHVKDEPHFRSWAQNLRLEVLKDSSGRLGFYSDDPVEEWVDLAGDLISYLADGEFAVVISTSHGRARCMGRAFGVNSAGEGVSLYLSDIYVRAARAFGIDPTTIKALCAASSS